MPVTLATSWLLTRRPVKVGGAGPVKLKFQRWETGFRRTGARDGQVADYDLTVFRRAAYFSEAETNRDSHKCYRFQPSLKPQDRGCCPL